MLARTRRNWNPHTLLAGMLVVQPVWKIGSSSKCSMYNYHVIQKFHSCRSIPKKLENIHAQTKTSEHKCSKQHVCKSQKLETTPMSIYWWRERQDVAYSYNGTFFSLKKKWNTGTCYNIDGFWKYHVKYKKPDKKRLHKSTYIQCSEQADPQRQKVA